MPRIAILGFVSAVLALPLAGQGDSVPEGVTPTMIATGQRLFHGQGICLSCHGQNGRGVRNLGPDLGDAEWVQGDGSYRYIVGRILAGVAADSSKSGVVMPPRGGSRLTDEQVRAVAAYVWSLRRGR